MSEQSNVVDQLTEKLRASNVQDGAPSDDWKQKLNLPAKDNRQQTEVCRPTAFILLRECASTLH